MKPVKTPDFHFERNGNVITAWFSPHPLLSAEGKMQYLSFKRECNSDLEATLLIDYLNQFNFEIKKHFFTEGYNTKKRKEQNWYL